ncbi:SDR family NAD(P)-dependent oxidoreductase [Streptomyces sp. NPDC058417]|uniref:SDR family NAD(P)-dependent oxidoreductase n=3 Tax=Streptomyces TaxID=1883 RepID=UPI003651CDBB
MPANASPLQPSEPTAPSEPTTAEALRDLLASAVAEATGLDPAAVDPHRPLAESGLGSRQLVALGVELGERLGRTLDPSLVFNHPTVAALAAALADPSPGAGDGTRPDGAVRPQRSARPDGGPESGSARPDHGTDIALVSMACRFPGGADDPEALWRLLDGERDVISEVPGGRWDTAGLLDPDPEATGTAYTLRGGYLDAIDRFDAAFFGVSPREAAAMDPQQRLLLQTAWETLERAGIVPDTLSGSSTGVYVGLYDSGYLGAASLAQLDGHVGTGSAASVASGRIAYTLGLQGPAVTVDTACSSSLVALHLAARALAAGECDLALAGGVTLMVTPRGHVEFSRLRGLSPSGRCSPFSADADGVVWAEGCGLVLLKRLDDARRDGDRVLAVVKGSALNQDGRSQGLSAPNGPAQERVLRAALDAAGLRPDDIDLVEAHGTGTPLGDPIEGNALAAVYGPGRPADRPLGVGSLKSNIGHTQAAAGIGGVIKTVLALGHERIPASLHAGEPSSLIAWDGGGLRVLTAAEPWPRRADRVRRAGVSAFGISGTNAHVVLEEAPAELAPVTGGLAPATSDLAAGAADLALGGGDAASADAVAGAGAGAGAGTGAGAGSGIGEGAGSGGGDAVVGGAADGEAGAVAPFGSASRPLLFPLSARSLPALAGQAERLAAALRDRPGTPLAGVAATLARHRTHFPHRAVVQAADHAELLGALDALAAGTPDPDRTAGPASPLPPGKVAFVFPGQGSQWAGMARDLLAHDPVFADELDRCDGALRPFTDWSVAAVLRGDPGAPSLDRVDVVQPALFAVMVSLAAVWRARGVRPDAVIGHSQGEVAAACVAGALSLSDAAAVVALRSRALTGLSGTGTMAVVALPHTEVEARIAADGLTGRVSVAAVNSGRSTVIAGEADPLVALLDDLERAQVFVRLLDVDYASHSAQVEPVRDEILDELDGVTALPTAVTWYSTVTAEPVTDELEADYWYANLREPVRFAPTVARMAADGYRWFVELAPHPSLSTALRTLGEETGHDLLAVGSLRRDADGPACLDAATARLHAHGREIDWRRLLPAAAPVELPTYAWDLQRHWTEPEGTAGGGPGLFDRAAHPLLGVQLRSADETRWTFRDEWSPATADWLPDHAVFGRTVVSGTTLLELCRAALAAARPDEPADLAGLLLLAPLVLPATGTVEVSVDVVSDGSAAEVSVHSRPRGADAPGWTLHATASAAPSAPRADRRAPDWPADAVPAWDPAAYARLTGIGLGYGPAFQGVREAVRTGDGTLLARLSLPAAARDVTDPYPVHPALLDAALHVAAALDGADGDDRVLLPVAVGRVVLDGGADDLLVSVRRTGDTATDRTLDVTLWDTDGFPVGRLEDVRLRAATAADLSAASENARHLYEVAWTVVPTVASVASLSSVPSGPSLSSVPPVPSGPSLSSGPTVASVASLSSVPSVRDGGSSGGAVSSAGGVSGARPETVVRHWPGDPDGGERVDMSARLAAAGLAELRALVALPPGEAPARTVWVTRGAVATGPGDGVPGLAQSVLWGLARSARAEHPDLGLVLLDIDGDVAPGTGTGTDVDTDAGTDTYADATVLADGAGLPDGLLAAVAASDEPELVYRGDTLLAPRLVRSRPADPAGDGPALPAEGTVLITGGLGAVGRQIGRLLAEHGVPRLLLTSRRGADDPRAAEVAAELAALGAEIEVAACDVADADALAALLDAIGDVHPLRGVVHCAGLLDDGVIADLTPERLAAVLRPKAVGAAHLHRLTAHLPLDLFLLVSSAAGVLGNAGQANYAAANVFLDQLAHHRRARGLPATSVSYGAWAGEGLAAEHADLARMARLGHRALTPEQGRDLTGLALRRDAAHLVAWVLDLPRLRETVTGVPLWRSLLPAPASAGRGGGLADRLAALPAAERADRVLTLVREEASRALGLRSAESVRPDRPLRELGMDSVTAVDLRNRIGARLAVRLPATLLFDHPTPERLARHLLDSALGGSDSRTGNACSAPPAASPAAADEPVAIVAMACRLPGGVEGPDDLWRLVAEGRDAVGPFPADRWDVDSLYDPDPEAPGKSYAREGGFLDDIDAFDAGFFGITPKEAAAMDPQQRLLLETAWEALERAGIVPADLSGSSTGVYVGMFGSDYLAGTRLDQLDGYVGTGSAPSVASGRLAYALGLHGPALTVDTACSSSLVATHLAVQALRSGECDLALAGGVTLMVTPQTFVEFSRLRGLSATGRCRSFSDDADGAIWSEGAGLLVLKRLSDARRDGDEVLAVLRGTAVNQDGRSQGLSAPNGPAQEQVLRRALAQSGLGPQDIDYVEAHGTGTSLGDPIEANALATVFGPSRPADRPLLLGSLKSNLGHTQAASGVAGLIKVVQSLRHGTLPATLHAATPSRHVDWADSGLSLVQEARPWPATGDRPRRAGVSAFGISGTNAHVVVEEAPTVPASPAATERSGVPASAPEAEPADRKRLFVLSARSETALRGQAARLSAHLAADTSPHAPPSPHVSPSLPDLARTLARHRGHFEHRAAVVAGDADELRSVLDALASGRAPVTAPREETAGKVAFVVAGHGGHWPGMGLESFADSAAFRTELTRIDAAVQRHAGWSVLNVLRAPEEFSPLERTEYLQPVLFAVNAALAAAWRALGVTPDAVVGHSLGEIAAAYTAGALGLDDAVRVVTGRAEAVVPLVGHGGMIAVGLPADETTALLAPYEGELFVGAYNSAHSTAVSGATGALTALRRELTERGVTVRPLSTPFASHSPLMEPLRDAFLDRLAGVTGVRSATPLYSAVHAAPVDGERLDAAHWFANLREPVRFADTVRRMLDDGYRYFVELSPHPSLTSVVAAVAAETGTDAVTIGSLRRRQDGHGTLLHRVGELYAAGHAPDWRTLFPRGRRVDAPTYAFARERHWLAPAPAGADAGSPLLGTHVQASDEPDRHLFESRVDLRDSRFAYLTDHRVTGEVWLPGAAFLGLALEAARTVTGATEVHLADVAFERALRLPEDAPVRLQLVLRPARDGAREFTVASAPVGAPTWERHVTGRLLTGPEPSRPAERDGQSAPNLDDLRARCAETVETAPVYAQFAALGIAYGPAFRNLESAERGDTVAVGRLAERPPAGHLLHPAVLDAAFHAAALPEHAQRGRAFVPAGFGRVHHTGRRTTPARVSCELRSASGDSATFDLRLWDDDDQLLLTAEEFRIAALSPLDGALFETRWQPRPAAQQPPADGGWLLLADTTGTADDLAARLGTDVPHVLARSGTGFAAEGPGRYVVDPADPAHLTRLLDEAFPDGPPARIVHLTALDAPAVTDGPTAADAARLGCLSLLHLVRAVTDRPRGRAPRLHVVTRGSQAAGDSTEVAHPEQALAWGFGLAVAQEYPELATTLVDLPPTGGADALWTTLRHADDERLVALRDCGRLVPRLTRTRPDADRPRDFGPDGVHLVTGGLGGLGRTVAERLVARGVRRLALLSRSAPSADAQRWIDGLRERGVAVHLARADVADRAGLTAALDAVRRDAGPLAGIVHAAGVLDDATVAHLTDERVLRVLAPKVLGTALLTELAPEAGNMILFASAAGLLGSPGQSHYSAANAFLDAWAHHLSRTGRQALSLDWGAWSGVGMVAGSGTRAAETGRSGLVAFSPQEGGELFDRVLDTGRRQLAPMALDWELLALAPDTARTRPILADLVSAPTRGGDTDGLVRKVFAATTDEDRRTWLEAYVRARVGEVSGGLVDPAAGTALKELGLDSLMLVRLRNSFARELGVELPTAEMFAAADIRGLAATLAAALPERTAEDLDAPPETAAPAGPGTAVADRETHPATRDVVRLLRSAAPGMPQAAHAVGLAARLTTPTDRATLTAVLTRLAARHAALRTAVTTGTTGRELAIAREVTVAAEENGVRDESGVRDASRLQGDSGVRDVAAGAGAAGPLLRWTPVTAVPDAAEGLRALLEPPFDLATAPLWRFELLDPGDRGDQVLLFGAHHAVSDLQSLLLVAAEIDRELSGTPLDGEVTNRDVRLLIEAQRTGEGTAADDWRAAFEGAQRLDLTLSAPRPAERSYRAGSVTVPLPDGLMDRVSAAASRLAVTPAAFCLGTLTVLLARTRERERFALAVPVDTRIHADAFDAVGFFGVPVPFPAEARTAETVADVVRRTDARMERLLARGAMFSDVLATLARQGLPRPNAPLVEVYFNYVRHGGRLDHLDVLPVGPGYSDLDLMITVTPDADRVRLDHNLDILDGADTTGLGEEFVSLLGEFAKDATVPVAAPAPRQAPAPTVALAATFALGHLPALCAAALRAAADANSAAGVAGSAGVRVVEAPYHQVLAALHDPSGVFADPATSVGVVLLRVADLERFGPVDDALLAELRTAYPAALRAVAERTRKPLVVAFPPTAGADGAAAGADVSGTGAGADGEDAGAVAGADAGGRFARWEREIADELSGLPGIAVLGRDAWTGGPDGTDGPDGGDPFDPRTERLAHLPFTPPFQAAVALRLAEVVRAALRPAPKVIAVDGDETLWSGVAGEIGPEAVDLSGPRALLARKLLRWREAGALLMLLSNNDEETVRAVLDRPESLLKPEHFSVLDAGWAPKPNRLADAARALNLGLDSFLFLDDNPAEIGKVRSVLPQVLAVTCPPVGELDAFLGRLWPLVPAPATAEDALRARFYDQERARDAVREQAGFEEFLARLDLEVDIRPLDEDDVPRAGQLVRRTNQFTLRARSADGGDLARWRERGEVWTASARDRFGDYGQIGLLAVRADGDRLDVLAWLMSCRALGRGVEERLLAWLADRADELGCAKVRLTAERTPRNAPARRIVAALGGGDQDDERLETVATPDHLRTFRSWQQ